MNEMKQMPYRVPDGFIEMSKIRNRAAVRRAATGRERLGKAVRWAVPAFATLVVAICAVIYFEPEHDRDMKRLMAQMETASDDVIYEMSLEVVDYAEDLSQL